MQKKLSGVRYPSNVSLFALRVPSHGSDRRNLQGVPEGIVPPAFVGARDASREVTRYSMPINLAGNDRTFHGSKTRLTSDRLAVAPTTSVDLLAYNEYRDWYLSEIIRFVTNINLKSRNCITRYCNSRGYCEAQEFKDPDKPDGRFIIIKFLLFSSRRTRYKKLNIKKERKKRVVDANLILSNS